ncbi:nucleotidyltransferase family protein [Vibrio barjaei]|uniref:nucleotidyltransferase family protein n=1 Tax=Vibrio barjaei TaxID=1676683 RepID=UPI002283BBAE|nr:nucleotidyltransferase family protein [Vibrio barjaei]MCY9872533.1 nucleotidyltransferase family protein [Vibrio barjaei]
MMTNWEIIALEPNDTIRTAMLKIEDGALRFAIVTDNDKHLLGTVTDGDIRRGLIAGKTLSDEVASVMNTEPYSVADTVPFKEVLSDLQSKSYLAAPVVKNGRVVGVHTQTSLQQKASYDNPVFLMAGGFGTRLKPLTDNCPKPLLHVGNKPILEIVLERFVKAGFHNFYVSTHYLPHMVREHFGNGDKWNVSITYVHEDEPLGTGGALGLLPQTLPDLPIIMCNGDVLTTLDFEKLLVFHNQQKGVATMCVREFDYQIPFGVVEADGTSITKLTEKPTYSYHVNAGIYVVERALIDTLQPNQNIDMPTLLESQFSKKVAMYSFYDYWLDIGRIDDFNRAQRDIRTLEL